ncbi:MAG: phage capsid protein, partial [Alphaproteobacteria bacterium]|nr:phage capsid protein [Alphaproteobacteria bacterium]
NVVGKSTTFQKVGTGQAVQKTRKGKLPLMNIDHGNVEVFLEDWHAPDFIDKFDELKIEHDERKVVVDAGAWALGRKTDEMIINNLNETTMITGDYSTAFTLPLISKGLKRLNTRKVPDDGKRFAALTPGAWEHFINLKQVSNAKYAGDLFPWLKGTDAIYWRKTTWQMITGLPGEGTSQAKCFIYHQSAAACATASEISTDAGWERTYHSFFVNNSLSQGAALIDENGVEAYHIDDTVDIT